MCGQPDNRIQGTNIFFHKKRIRKKAFSRESSAAGVRCGECMHTNKRTRQRIHCHTNERTRQRARTTAGYMKVACYLRRKRARNRRTSFGVRLSCSFAFQAWSESIHCVLGRWCDWCICMRYYLHH